MDIDNYGFQSVTLFTFSQMVPVTVRIKITQDIPIASKIIQLLCMIFQPLHSPTGDL